MSDRQSIFRSGVLVSVIFAASALLGFAREVALAAFFGTSRQTDALLVAMLIPNFFSDLLGEAALSAAIVPVFMSHIAPREDAEQRRIIGSVFSLASLILVPLAVVTMLGAPLLARVFAPGFSQDKLQLTVMLMRLMLPSIVFLGLANVVTGVLHSFKRFGAAAATGVVWNLAIVATTVPLAHRFGIFAPALGVLLGALLQLLIMLPSLKKTGFLSAVGFRFRDPALARMWSIFWPILAVSLVVQLVHTVDKIIASFLPTGSIAALSYADRIAGGPARIFAMAVSVVLFPALAHQVSTKSADLATTVESGLKNAAVLTLPWAAMFIALRQPVVAVLLQRGAFDARATIMVAFPLAIYSFGEFADGIGTLVNNAYYSHHDSRTPTMVNVASKVVRIAVVLALIRFLGYAAIAVGMVVGTNLALLLLLTLLRRKMPELDLAGIGFSLLRISAASAVGGVVAWFVFSVVSRPLAPLSTATGAAALALSFIPALVAYALVGHFLRVEEFADIGRRAVMLARKPFARQ